MNREFIMEIIVGILNQMSIEELRCAYFFMRGFDHEAQGKERHTTKKC